ncbi:META domain-containing protein [Xinfangfangia sp. CPCC 101601]|uniref:META domain-containing protein n=1 Tax=Pseudogemmobacter lacusdianii TaxID=3069608 RepID=A0ABU0VTC9_9RHOB|nr:META domain-containing protein [Xinfangfangia sp. CPCC 101601]MDQ2064984.1 META domain-containing protein [Xinfangfangia sp. CPCC 101601]
MTRLSFAKIAALTAALGLAAVPTFAQTPNNLIGEWHLVGINGLPANPGVTLNFEAPETGKAEAAFNGKAPCNRYFGTYTTEADRVTFSGVAATMMACPKLDEEGVYFKTLEPMTQIGMVEGHLVLMGPQDTVLEYSREVSDSTCITCGK